jgi:3-dehydroquinate dehydratase-2
MMRVLVLNGPNLNLLGTREPEVYGRTTMAEIEATLSVRAEELGVELLWAQSNSEGELIDRIHEAKGTADGLIINPGGLTHTSVSLLDALLAVGLPSVEVHLTNLARREEFRQHSLTARGVVGRVEGFGPEGYVLALIGLAGLLEGSSG